MTSLTFPGVDIATLQVPATPFVVANAAKWMLSSNGFRGPTQRYQPGASALFGVTEKWFVSDDYWIFAPRFAFTNWYLTTSGGGGQEAANGNAVTIEAVSLQVGLTGAPVQLALNGSTASYTLADDSEIWTDAPAGIAIPPRTLCCVRVARSVASSTSYLSAPGVGIRPAFGDKMEVGTSSLASKVMAGGISTALPSGQNVYGYGPVAMVSQGWDGRPVALVLGTSIEAGTGQSRLNCNEFGELGPTGLGMVSTFEGAPRLPGANFAVPGGLAAGISGSGAGQGLTKRARLFAALPNLPFTVIVSGFGTNDQSASLSTWQTTMLTLFTALRAVWPAPRLVQQELWSRLASSSDGFSTQAGQTLSSNWTLASGTAWGLSQWFKGGCPGNARIIDAYIPIMDEIDNAKGGGSRGLWRDDVLDKSWSTTLTAAMAAGANSFNLAARPRENSNLALTTDNPESVTILGVTNTASPFNASFGQAAVSTHALGGTVKEALCQCESSGDKGVHPGYLIAKWVADRAYARAKNAGLYG